jgi:cell division protein ZapA
LILGLSINKKIYYNKQCIIQNYFVIEKERCSMENRVKVVVLGKEYTLKTEESSTYIYSLAKSLEKKISEITQSTGSSPYNASIMIAMSALDEVSRSNTTVENMRNQIKEYVDEAGKSRIEKEAALKEIEILKNKIEQLESSLKLKQLKESI